MKTRGRCGSAPINPALDRCCWELAILHIVENVPARVNLDTGEQLFAPATVEHLQRLIWEHKKPARIMQVPVYEYA